MDLDGQGNKGAAALTQSKLHPLNVTLKDNSIV